MSVISLSLSLSLSRSLVYRLYIKAIFSIISEFENNELFKNQNMKTSFITMSIIYNYNPREKSIDKKAVKINSNSKSKHTFNNNRYDCNL